MKVADYTEGDAFQAEKRSVFVTGWLPVCAARQVPKAGDFQSVTVGGWSVVAIRGDDGAVRVLRNACRHQNMPVVGTPSGNCQNLRCRFHGWTYDLQGRFQSAPPQFAPPPGQSERDLLALATAELQGLAFFSMAQPSQPPSLPGPLPGYGGTLVDEIACNWKVAIEQLTGEGGEAAGLLLVLRRDGGTAVVQQVVPHTFLRTRLFSHVYGGEAASQQEAVAAIKLACERLQAERAAGTLPAASDFHRMLEKVYAGSS